MDVAADESRETKSKARSSRMQEMIALYKIGAYGWLLIIGIIVTIYLVPRVARILDRQEEMMAAQAEGMKKLPDLADRLAKLEKEISTLTTDSIDGRLRSVERTLQTGQLKPEEIASLSELRSDVLLLKTYMFRDARELVEFKQLQSDYHILRERQDTTATKSDVSTLQWIIGVGATILFALIAVPPIFNRGRSDKPIPTTPVQPPVIETKPAELTKEAQR